MEDGGNGTDEKVIKIKVTMRSGALNEAAGPGNGTSQSQQFYPGLPTGFPPQHFHSNIQPGPPVPSPTHLGHSSPPNPTYYKDERTQKQHIKLKKKLHEKQQKTDTLLPRKELVNGLKRSGIKEKGMNSVGTSEDGEESSVPDEEDSFQIITDILSSVQAPKVSELSSRSALLQWAPPIRLSESASNDSHEIDISESDLRYEVLLSDKSKEMKFKSIYSGASLSCRIQDLKPGQEYSVCLQVHLDELQGSATDPIKFITPPCEPDQPQSPKLIHRTKNSLQLRWNAVNDNGSHILHYILEYDDGRGEFVEFYKGRGKTHTLQKLLPATSYNFRLAVVNEVGKSLYSDPISYSTYDNPPTQPNPPALIEATVQSLHLQWNRRPKDDEFVLQMNDPKTKYGHMTVYNGRENYHICRGLTCFSDYTFRLRARNDDGISPWSEEVTYRTLPDRPARPSKPIVKGRIHAHSFKLKWEPPSDTGGAEITRYILEVNSGSGYETVYSGIETEAVCDKLTPGTTYQLRVSCISAGGCSNYSDPCTVTTDAISPGQCAAPRLHGKPKSNSITIRWIEPDYNGGAPVLDYEIEMVSPDSSRSIVHKSKEMECTVTNLSPGCDYYFTVRAVNRIGPGVWSEPLKVTSGAAPPAAPEIPTLHCKSPFHIYVEWQEPPCNGAAITEYRLEMSPELGEDKFYSVYQGHQMNYDIKGLNPFHTYYFRVQASNSAGYSLYSPVAATLTPAAPPSTVTTLRSESTPTSIILYWNHPADNGSDIIHYNIEIGDKTISTESPLNEYTLENLQPDTLYKIKIQAVNGVAPGSFSSTLRTSTLRLPPAAPKLECVGVGHNYLKLKWGEGKNTDYIQYCVEMENTRSREFQCVYKGTALTCKVNKLHEVTTYKFKINASNDAGVGDFSREYEFTTSIAPPTALKIPKLVEVEQKICTLEWLPARNVFTDPIVYQVQLTRLKDQTFRQVYKGPESKCVIEDLEPGTEYQARVCPIRVTMTGELPGPYSPTINFSTLAAEPTAVLKLASPSTSSPSHMHKGRTLYHSLWQMFTVKQFPDEYCTYVYVILVMLIGIVISLGIAAFL
ncbi:fibronectin type-III domain-containing protein 3A isoform X4 [Anoplophora glabripennis]|uniref:fibronectin type-III domain-containing protein 3A isoform X4 n=1 Tax=Anoplophora glabripennis TaxID=217634 RepID=UPI0008739C80|nr:fibronectin type-III domain-containing protein 3A isoform X4 [Anoplophora glabripennis]